MNAGRDLATVEPVLHSRELGQQLGVALRVAQAFGGVDVGHGEAVADQPAVGGEVALQPFQRAAQLFGRDRQRRLHLGQFGAARFQRHQ
ncbi:MAG: hypothetical protein V9E89_19155 [Ilumatobacteraceae bacterium]